MQSRYYNPEWGRLINADALGGQVGILLSHNIFVYCQNNIVNMADPSGFVMMCMAEGGSGGSSIAPKNNGMIGTNLTLEACGIFIGAKATIEFVTNEDKMSMVFYAGGGPYNGVPGVSLTEGTTEYSTSDIRKLNGLCWDAGGSVSGAIFTGEGNVVFSSEIMGSGQSFGMSLGRPGPSAHIIPVLTVKIWKTTIPSYPLIIDPT